MFKNKYIDNHYQNLYETDFYKMNLDFLSYKPEKLNSFEQQFALANVVYTEALKNLRLVGNIEHNGMIDFKDKDAKSTLAMDILSKDAYIYKILKDMRRTEQRDHHSERATAVDYACIYAGMTMDKVKEQEKYMKDKKTEIVFEEKFIPANAYSNLFETDFYKINKETLKYDEEKTKQFEETARIANAVYVSSLNHLVKKGKTNTDCRIDFSDRNLRKVSITDTLEQNNDIDVLGFLELAEKNDSKLHPTKETTALTCARKYCELNLEKIKEEQVNPYIPEQEPEW